jgi:murein DD-endopeptidase MepM/ murein hydrolase activator NlpD
VKFEVEPMQLWWRLILLLAFMGFCSGWFGYKVSSYYAIGKQTQTDNKLELELLSEREQSEQLRSQTQQKVQSLTSHVARLEANLMRINSLGGSLVKLAELDPDEFQFDIEPGMGGPLDLEVNSIANIGIDQLLYKLEHLFDIRYQQLSQMQHIFQHKLGKESFKLSGKARPVKKGWVSSYYGYRIDPINGKKAWHKGVDIAGSEGMEIVSVASGIVSLAQDKGAYGQTVEIKHGNSYTTRYGHNKKLLVKKGDLIKKGDTIALMGSTGRSTGPHLHFEVHKDGKSIDPGTIFSDLKRKS